MRGARPLLDKHRVCAVKKKKRPARGRSLKPIMDAMRVWGEQYKQQNA